MRILRSALVLALLLVVSKTTAAQMTTPTGTPPFGSFDGGRFDVINLSNLNVHLAIPVLHKHGRGVDFDFDITYDNSVFYSPSVNGLASWMPTNQWGWFYGHVGTTSAASSQTTGYCYTLYPPPIGYIPTGVAYGFSFQYIDLHATPHLFLGGIAEAVGSCGSGYSGYLGPAIDGSGYTSSIDGSGNLTVLAKIRKVIVWTNSGGQTPSETTPYATDKNGNQLSTDNNGHYYDTLSSAAPVLTATGVAPSPTTFTYTAPSGANASFTMKYTSYTVKTNFACSGIAEYGPTSQNLPSEIDLPDGTKYTFTYEATPGYSGDVTGRIASVTLPTGGTIAYTYTGSHNGIVCSDGSAAGLTRQTPDGTWTYTRTLGTGAATTTTVSAPLYNGQNNQTVMNFQGIYPTETQVYQGSASGGTLLNTSVVCYNGSTPTGTPATCNSAAITLPITQIARWTILPGGLQSQLNTLYDQETVYGFTNSYGLVTERDEYAYGSGSPGPLVRKTLTTYASLGNNIVDRPATITVKDGSGNVKAQTSYCYDEGTPSGTTMCNAAGSPTATSGTPQHASITGSRGNATTIAYLVAGSATLGREFTYFDTGNILAGTDVNGAQSTYTYGACGNSYPTSVAEALNLSRSMAWNCVGGVQTSSTDENGKTTSTGYTDANFWRPASQTDPLSNVTNITYSGQASTEVAMNFNGNSSTVDTLTTLDSLGRTHVVQKRHGPGSSTFDSVETDYDAVGRSYKTTLPYAASGGQLCSGACPGTTTTLDALGRPLQITDSGGGTAAYTYTQNDTYISAGPNPSGENAKRKQIEYDALGRITSVCEVTSASGNGTCAQTSPATGYWTKYTYNISDNLTGVTQNAQSSTTQTRSYGYDDLGRMTSETNPETGTTTYTYDSDATCGTSNGDLVKTVDAVGNTTCLTYDALHRVTNETYPSGSYAAITPKKYFVYDSATVNGVTMINAKTRVAEAYTCYVSCTTKLTDEGFSYTARGEASDVYQSTPNSGGYYHVTQTYWEHGAVKQVSGLSSLPTITYNVDGEGRIYSATASAGQNPLSSTTYNVASLPTQVNFGSSDSDSFAYDSNTNRLMQYTFTVNSQSVIGNLTWNAVGTLASLLITDQFNSSNTQSCSYSHDDLIRITSANCGSAANQTFSYDPFGNINKSGSPYSFQPNYSASTNQMTSIGSSTPSYDANGNVTNDSLHAYNWDADGRPNTIDGVGITYDALDRLVEQNRSGAYTHIVYTPSGGKLALMNGSALQKGFVSLTGGAMAVYNSSGLAYYRHSDLLGSSRFASTPSRTMYSDSAYAPFGEAYAQAGTTDLSFTGMNQDTVTNLYDFPAREYGIQGRWPSPDPAGISSANPTDPQSWNRYAYVRNSPLFMVDPTGLDDCEIEACIPGMPFPSNPFGGVGYDPSDPLGFMGPGAPPFGVEPFFSPFDDLYDPFTATCTVATDPLSGLPFNNDASYGGPLFVGNCGIPGGPAINTGGGGGGGAQPQVPNCSGQASAAAAPDYKKAKDALPSSAKAWGTSALAAIGGLGGKALGANPIVAGFGAIMAALSPFAESGAYAVKGYFVQASVLQGCLNAATGSGVPH